MKGLNIVHCTTEEQRNIVKACNSALKQYYHAYRLSLLVFPFIVLTLVVVAAAIGFFPEYIAISSFVLLLLLRLLPGDASGVFSYALVGVNYASYQSAILKMLGETQMQLQASGLIMTPDEWDGVVREACGEHWSTVEA